MKINGVELSQAQVFALLEKESEKERTKLNYNFFKLLDALRKCRKDFDIKSLLEKTDQELLAIQAKLELPSLDRKSKDNLSFTDRKKEVPKEFKNKIKIEG